MRIKYLTSLVIAGLLSVSFIYTSPAIAEGAGDDNNQSTQAAPSDDNSMQDDSANSNGSDNTGTNDTGDTNSNDDAGPDTAQGDDY